MPTRPYLISPPDLQPGAFATLLARALDAGDVGAFQLRLKDVPDAAVLAAGAALLPVCREREVAFILNDRPDLAREMGADGVHVGREDASVAEARALMGEAAVIGATCHNSRHLAMEAGEAGADYVAFGAFFPTATKQPPAMAEPEIIEWWTDLFTLPSVAIGGITAHNCAPLVKAGADFLAASSFIWAHPNGPARAVEALSKAIAEAS